MNTISPTHLQDTVQSPFLPNTSIQFAWDSTSIGLAKTCPRLYQYTMIDGWTPKDESIHLRFGIEYHKALEDYDREKVNNFGHESAVQLVVANLLHRTYDWKPDESTKAGRYKNRKSLLGLVIDYLDHFNSEGASDPAETLILDNGKPAVELSFRFELDFGPRGANSPYILSGHLDRVVTFNGANLVMDRKTTTTTPGPYYFKQYEPNNQMTLYTLAGKVILHTPIKGVVIDAAQVLLEKPNAFVRGFTYRTPAQLDEWITDLRVLFSTFESYAEANYYPMNDTACDKFGGCRFRDICSKDPGVRERFLKNDFIKQPPEERWNPLRPR